jgi:hypothetical protein
LLLLILFCLFLLLVVAANWKVAEDHGEEEESGNDKRGSEVLQQETHVLDQWAKASSFWWSLCHRLSEIEERWITKS